MSIAKAMEYEDIPMKKSKKSGIMVISEMSTMRILWYVTMRHKVGLLMLANLGLVSYLAWDKVLHLFF